MMGLNQVDGAPFSPLRIVNCISKMRLFNAVSEVKGQEQTLTLGFLEQLPSPFAN